MYIPKKKKKKKKKKKEAIIDAWTLIAFGDNIIKKYKIAEGLLLFFFLLKKTQVIKTT